MIHRAIILAAGLGTRMRPLTDKLPKSLIDVGGTALIDHKFAALSKSSINTVVVNVHYLADQMEKHLGEINAPKIIISDERSQLMNSGGGIAKALPSLGNDPFFVLNSDAFWHGDNNTNLVRMVDIWNPDKMDILMGLADRNQSIGFPGAGDFFRSNSGQLTRRGQQKSAPFAFTGDYIIKPDLFENAPKGKFSANILYDQAIAKERLFGTPLEGMWLHVGTPQSLNDANQAIALASNGVQNTN